MARLVTASVTGMDQMAKDAEGEYAALVTGAMRGATSTLKNAARGQILAAGMGQRLANTWRGNTYPNEGNSLSPAGWVYSKAPDIISAFATGATIHPLGDHHYLWIPTKNVPRALGSGRATSTKRMTPEQVLTSFHASEFIIKNGKRGNKLAFLAQKRGVTARGARKRVRRGRIGHGDDSELVLMFTLTTSVDPGRILDLDEAGQEGADDFVERMNQGGISL